MGNCKVVDLLEILLKRNGQINAISPISTINLARFYKVKFNLKKMQCRNEITNDHFDMQILLFNMVPFISLAN